MLYVQETGAERREDAGDGERRLHLPGVSAEGGRFDEVFRDLVQ